MLKCIFLSVFWKALKHMSSTSYNYFSRGIKCFYSTSAFCALLPDVMLFDISSIHSDTQKFILFYVVLYIILYHTLSQLKSNIQIFCSILLFFFDFYACDGSQCDAITIKPEEKKSSFNIQMNTKRVLYL